MSLYPDSEHQKGVYQTELELKKLFLELALSVTAFFTLAGVVTSIDILCDQVQVLQDLGVLDKPDVQLLIAEWQKLGLPDKAAVVPVSLVTLLPLILTTALSQQLSSIKKKLRK